MQLFAYQEQEVMAMTFLQLQSPIRWMFLIHALCGATALGVFLIPLLSKKGGKLHTRAGWVYTAVMIIVGISAYVITPWRAFFDPERTDAGHDHDTSGGSSLSLFQ